MRLTIFFLLITLTGFSQHIQVAKKTDYGRGYLEYIPQQAQNINQDAIEAIKNLASICGCEIDIQCKEDTIKFPLIIFLHGSGERGNGTTEIWAVANQGLPKLIERGAEVPFVVLSPQQTKNKWDWKVDGPAFIKWAKINYTQIDTTRVIVTGLSMGGDGSWDVSYGPSDLHLAAIVPVSGKGGFTQACDTYRRKTPVFVLWGAQDGSVTEAKAYDPIKGMMRCGAIIDNKTLIWDKIPGYGHSGDFWDRVYWPDHKYYNPNIYDWMIQQQWRPY